MHMARCIRTQTCGRNGDPERRPGTASWNGDQNGSRNGDQKDERKGKWNGKRDGEWNDEPEGERDDVREANERANKKANGKGNGTANVAANIAANVTATSQSPTHAQTAELLSAAAAEGSRPRRASWWCWLCSRLESAKVRVSSLHARHQKLSTIGERERRRGSQTTSR